MKTKYIKDVRKTITKWSGGSVEAEVNKDRWSRQFTLYFLDKNGKIENCMSFREKEIKDIMDFFKANKNFKHYINE